MLRRFAAPFLLLFVGISLTLHCQIPQDPADLSNTSVELLIRNSHWLESNLSITDTVDKPIQIGIIINLPENIDSIRLSVKAEGKSLFDTLLQSFSSSYKDTIWKTMSFADTGDKFVSIVPYSQVIKLSPVSAGITIAKKTSTIQSANHSPKWTEKILSVALNDTLRYELNVSTLCSDPDKDILHYAISGKALPGDTIIDSLYVFQASAATIGKNSVQLIASDPSGLKDTMELVLNVTASGTDNSSPEVTIIAPDRDSSVTNAENYVVDMLCSDASGIDSVYAVFNGKTTSAVLENGHYKIAITGLVAGFYNTIELTVRDKSINALKTTKTIKIKYAQGFTVTYDANTGTGTAPVDGNKYEAGTVVTVLDSGTLVKKGYTFTGWNTLADGSGTARAVTTRFNMTAINVTLYAQWKIKQYTVTYNGNGSTTGNVPVDVNHYDTGTSVTVLANTGGLIKNGYTFDGWNTAENDSGTSFVAGTGTFAISSNITLFAKWKIKTYTLTYDGNGNTGGTVPADVSLDSNALATVAANTGSLLKTGFDFNGWNTIANGSGTALASGATFRIKRDTTLYAQWTVKKYTLTISAPVNGTVNLSGNVTVDSNVTTPITATASSGFKFKCWRVTSGSAIIADTTAASTTVKLTQGNASIKAVFACFTFEKVIDYNNGQYISPVAITQGTDGCYYLAANTLNSNKISVVVVMKLDSKGNVIATQTYGYGTFDNYVNSINPTSDGCFVMGGTDNGQMNIRKISQSLNWLAEGSYSDLNGTHITGCFAFESKSGSFILGGGGPARIFNLPSIGITASWEKGYDTCGGDYFFNGQEVNAGDFIFIGDNYHFAITKTDANGNVLWHNRYPGLTIGLSIKQTADGGFIAGGCGGDYGETPYSCGLIKISSGGSVEWQKTNSIGEGGVRTVRQTADGGFVYVANTRILGHGETDIYLVKTDSNGEIIWNKAFGTSNSEYATSMELAKDGGFIILGSTGGASDSKCYVIKTDENGNVE